MPFSSVLPCALLGPGPSPGLAGGGVLSTGFTCAAGVEGQRLLLISITCAGAMGSSRRLLFRAAAGTICCMGRLVTL